MLKLKTLPALYGVLLLAAPLAIAQELPSAITTDPVPDKEFPPSMEAPDILSHGSRLNAVMYIASGRGPHPVVLLMHGFPGNEKNLDLAYSLYRAGWDVLIPHYRGAWGSAGTFSFSNAIEDTHSAVQFVRVPENAKKCRIDPKRIVLIGHSMGGFMAAYTTAHDPEIAGAVLISAWNIGAEMSRELSPGRRELFAGASPRLAGTTAEGLAAEGKQNAARWNYNDWVNALQTRPLLIVESHDGTVADNKILAEGLRKAGATRCTETYLETDHVYSDHRIALQATVLNWLQAQFPAAAK